MEDLNQHALELKCARCSGTFKPEWTEYNKKECSWAAVAGFDTLDALSNFLSTEREKKCNCEIGLKKLEQCCIPGRSEIQGRDLFLPS